MKELEEELALDFGKPLECKVCGKALPDHGVVISILVETRSTTASRHFCSMEHLIDYIAELKESGSPMYQLLHERGKEEITLKSLFGRISELERMVMEAVKRKAELEERIKALEEEKAGLLAEIEALRVIPELEAKASALETEVATLREEKAKLEGKAVPPVEAPPPAEEEPCEEKPTQ